MLILILIGVWYSQKAVFSFEKGSNCQNHFSSGSHQPVKKFPQQNFLIPPPLTTIWKILILVLKNNTSILRKKGSFSNKMCCSLTALFLKTKIYFCCCNFITKLINKNSSYCFFCIDCSQYVEPKNVPENVCSSGNGTPNLWVPTKNGAAKCDKLIKYIAKYRIL